MSSVKYKLLPADEAGANDGVSRFDAVRRASTSMTARSACLLLLFSAILNVGQFVVFHFGLFTNEPQVASPYAGLLRNVKGTFREQEWADLNSTEANLSWQVSDFDPNLLSVAVDNDWAAAKGLPTTQPWPWDETKGIYSKFIHTSLYEFHASLPQSVTAFHVQHCVQLLRDDIVCNADDSLTYTGRLHGQEDAEIPTPGRGQERKCKSWTDLMEWVSERSACYWPIASTGPDFLESERYKFCPDGKKHWE